MSNPNRIRRVVHIYDRKAKGKVIDYNPDAALVMVQFEGQKKPTPCLQSMRVARAVLVDFLNHYLPPML